MSTRGRRVPLAIDTDFLQPHLQYATFYEKREINGTMVKVRAEGGMVGHTPWPTAGVFPFCGVPLPLFAPAVSDIWCGIRLKLSAVPCPFLSFLPFWSLHFPSSSHSPRPGIGPGISFLPFLPWTPPRSAQACPSPPPQPGSQGSPFKVQT